MVTIAIPFHNAEVYLDLAIKSVLIQTYSDWKLLLVDDGSTDKSLEIARKYERFDSRIQVYSDGLNKNLAVRLNEIPSLTTTKYLARMDADDIMHPDRIESQINILKSNADIDVLGSNAYSIDSENNIQGIRMKISGNATELISVKGFIHPTIIAKTEWFIKNPYDENLPRAQDYELWTRTCADSIFKVYTEPLLYYREQGSDYYKKYFKGISSKFYVAKKTRSYIDYTVAFKYLLTAIVYYTFNKIGIEKFLLEKRNFHINDEKIKQAKFAISQIIN